MKDFVEGKIMYTPSETFLISVYSFFTLVPGSLYNSFKGHVKIM